MRNPFDVRRTARALLPLALLAALAGAGAAAGHAQTAGGQNYGGISGDLKIAGQGNGAGPLSFDLILYYLDGRVHSRQKVAGGGRYRFFSTRAGEYDIVVEHENQEVARLRVNVPATGLIQDIELAWKGGRPPARSTTVSAADVYERGREARASFEKAQAALDRKDYAQAVSLLKQITDGDAKDFQAWTELGTAHLLQGRKDEAEAAYLRAVEARPAFFLAQMNLGRLRSSQKKFEEAVEPLTRAAEAQPSSAEANLLLGEAYLQLKKGSKAVPYLNEAARRGSADAHVRLATLYHAAGMKDRAAAEYEQFLSTRPDAPDRKKLEQYIKENKKQ